MLWGHRERGTRIVLVDQKSFIVELSSEPWDQRLESSGVNFHGYAHAKGIHEQSSNMYKDRMSWKGLAPFKKSKELV